MLRRALFAIAFTPFLLVTSALLAEDKQANEFEQFKMGRTCLDTNLEDFKKQFPTATVDKSSNAKIGTTIYMVEPEGMSRMFVHFLNGKVYIVEGIWSKSKLDEIGGWQTVFDKITTKFGKAHADSPGIISDSPLTAKLIWRNKSSTQQLEFKLNETSVNVQISNEALVAELKERRRKINSGIED